MNAPQASFFASVIEGNFNEYVFNQPQAPYIGMKVIDGEIFVGAYISDYASNFLIATLSAIGEYGFGELKSNVVNNFKLKEHIDGTEVFVYNPDSPISSWIDGDLNSILEGVKI
jgi:hypothetical protein